MRATVVVVWIAAAVASSAASAPPDPLRADRAGVDSSPRRLRGLDLFRPSPTDNPLSRARVELGRRLFRDRRLSGDGSMACVDCHEPRRAYTNGRTTATGVTGTHGTRNVPTLINRAWGKSYFWDGRAATLEEQVLQPVLDRGELAMTARGVVTLVNTASYRELFLTAFAGDSAESVVVPGRVATPAAAFPIPMLLTAGPSAGAYRIDDPYEGLSRTDAATLHRVSLALASYVRTIQSGDSPLDRYDDGDRHALDRAAIRGANLFRGRAGCIGCHNGPLFSDERFHNTGIAWRSGVLTDVGRARVTGLITDLGAFKTPTLREVARTGPYMHDGSFETLDAVVDYYDTGGAQNRGLDVRLRRLGLTSGEKRDLVAFLRSLSGIVRDLD